VNSTPRGARPPAAVSANIRLVPATTLEAAEYWQGSIDFLYIDADHSRAGVLRDLEAWLPHMRRGGMIAGDDYGHPLYPGVQVAWDLFEQLTAIPLTRFQSTPPREDGIHLVYATI
jgi:predicted O-methyltransferase YrrM